MRRLSHLLCAVTLLGARMAVAGAETASTAPVAAPAIKAGDTFAAKDTLNCGAETSTDAAECLKGLTWTCQPFTVTCQSAKGEQGDWLLRFPSPVPVGEAVNDLVAMEWHMATDKDGKPVRGPAMVIVHESGRGMVAARVFANGLRAYGIHTFLVHLPGYGARTPAVKPDIKAMLPALKQAVGDIRRARDAVEVLPFVDTSRIGLLGISLGGFVTATVSGLDRGYGKIFVLLAGGNLPDVIMNGTKDAAKVRQMLQAAGISETQIRESSRPVEPMRLAHRVDAGRTWLFSGTHDEVVPPSCSLAFAKAAGLDADHHIQLPVGHYTAVVMLPVILQKSADLLLGTAQTGTVSGEPVKGKN
ncbi:MAG TPA: prolyl oligopeptidase family serine peptidase [Verrucomicrobiales bacterium]|nr:prolyl oligopeptidase family serine peptidase [Verrucomicrobiales bacterium]